MKELRGLPAPKMYGYAGLESIARLIRRRLVPEVTDDKPLPMMTALQRLSRVKVNVAGRRCPVSYDVQDKLGPGVEGLTRYNQDRDAFEIVLDVQTYDLLEEGVAGRHVFTLPHEVAHLFLHRDLLLQLGTIPHHRALLRESGRHAAYRDTEWQANAVAAAMSMPVAGLVSLAERRQLTPASVQRVFGVSGSAAVTRIKIFYERHEELLRAADMWG